LDRAFFNYEENNQQNALIVSLINLLILCRGAAVVGCLGGIVGYVQVPAVPELVGSCHATVEYESSPIDS
jgi:xanthosine utilization system XapX-like protein